MIYVFRSNEEIDYEEMGIEAIIEMSEAQAPYYYIVHARDLTAKEKRRLRQSRKP